MEPIWAVQTNAVNQLQAEAVAKAIASQGGKAYAINVFPSTKSIEFLMEDAPDHKNLIPYGSTSLVELAMEREWSGVFRNDNFTVSKWNESRPDMLNRDSVNMLVKDLPVYMSGLPNDLVVFIRPAIGKKLFPGQTATVADILKWMESGVVGRFAFPPEMEVTVAVNKVISDEARWFVVDGKVVDGSAYRVRGQRIAIHDNNENNLRQAQELANIWLPHPTCVMDLALTEEGLKVIEFNTFNSSGFYHHDIPKIVKAVNDSVRVLG